MHTCIYFMRKPAQQRHSKQTADDVVEFQVHRAATVQHADHKCTK